MNDSDPSSGDEQFPRRGLGGSLSTAYENSVSQRLSSPSSDSQFSSASEDFQDHKSGLPSAFGGAKARVRKRRRVQSRPSTTKPVTERATDPGQWERHTRGIGSKILAKHGFTGRLGKRGDGIAAPIEPVFRPEKLGLGAGGFSEKADAIEVEETIEKANRKTMHAKQQRNEQYHLSSNNAFEKVIDMREALPREVRSVEALLQSDHKAKVNEKKEMDERLFASPEILYNLQMLVDNARSDVSKAKRRRDTEKLIMQTAKREVERAELEKEKAKQALAYVSEVDSLFYRFVGIGKAADPKVFENCLKQLVTVLKKASEQSYVSTQLVSEALTELVSERVEEQMNICVLQGEKQGKVDKKQVRDIYRILAEVRNALDLVTYIKLCTRAILTPLRRHVSRPSWDIVRGACVGDAVSWLRQILPEAVLKIFAEEVLAPRLLSRLRTHHASSLVQTGTEVPAHVWIHPWLPATGRRSLNEVLHLVRITLSKSLQKWKSGDSTESRVELIAAVKSWSKVLSRRKLQLALSRHITPKLGHRLTRIAEGNVDEQDVKDILEEITAWAEVGSARLFAKDLSQPFLCGPGTLVQKAAFADSNWEKAKEVYLLWAQYLPKRLKEYMQPTLAALLFVLHAARVTIDVDTRQRLQRADLSPLLKNVFERRVPLERQRKTAQSENIGTSRETQKARLVDVVEMVGKREGLAVVGLGEERGMRVFQVGTARVVVDVERNVFVVRGRVVDVDEMVRLAKGG